MGSGTQTPSPDESDDSSPEELLIDALDRAALRLIAVLEDQTKDDLGNYAITFDQRMDAFKTTMQWVATRRRTKIEDPEASQRGVEDMQRRMQEGRNAATSPPEPPRRGRGRPSNAEIAERARLAREAEAEEAKRNAQDDSIMRRRLTQGG